VTVHDLIFEKFPQYFPAIDRASYRWRYRWSARQATGIIAVSHETRGDLIECYQIDPARITVIPPVRDPAFAIRVAPERQAAIAARYRLPANYLLSIGTLEPRKNQQMLVEAIARLDRNDTPPLVLIGRDGGAERSIRATARRWGVTDRVWICSDVATNDLPALLQRATLFLYPSRAEGFGLPIVEALSAGVPVIAANGPCRIEAGGPGTRYLPADEVSGWAAAIDQLLADSDGRASMATNGMEHAAQFDGDRVAAKLLAVYDATVSTGPLP
jgi:glycosyltransferase involved in cell wall biosynthesis